jgi:hypothetical protein
MHLIAGFDSNVYVEIALEEIKEQFNITDEQIAFIEMTPQEKPQTFLDTIHYSDGSSSIDAIGAGAVMGGVLGIIYGSVMWLGSLLIGLLGFFLGGLFGFYLDNWIAKKRKRQKPIRHIEILLLIQCESKEQAQKLSNIFRTNNVISLGLHL